MNIQGKGIATLCGALAMLGSAGLPMALAQQGQGYYSAAQATQGQLLFNDNCAQCHRPDLTGAMGPALVGAAFVGKWTGRPLGDLYAFEHANMPAVNPGSLPDSILLPITAYVLQKNGFAAGSRDISRDTLGQMLPKPPNG